MCQNVPQHVGINAEVTQKRSLNMVKDGLEYVKRLEKKGFWIMDISKRIPTEYSTFNTPSQFGSSIPSLKASNIVHVCIDSWLW